MVNRQEMVRPYFFARNVAYTESFPPEKRTAAFIVTNGFLLEVLVDI